MDWRERRLCLPIKKDESGHFHLQFFPMSEISTSLTISFKTNHQCVFNFTFSRSFMIFMRKDVVNVLYTGVILRVVLVTPSVLRWKLTSQMLKSVIKITFRGIYLKHWEQSPTSSWGAAWRHQCFDVLCLILCTLFVLRETVIVYYWRFDRIGERFSFQSVTRSVQDSSNHRSWDRHLKIIQGEPQEAAAAFDDTQERVD